MRKLMITSERMKCRLFTMRILWNYYAAITSTTTSSVNDGSVIIVSEIHQLQSILQKKQIKIWLVMNYDDKECTRNHTNIKEKTQLRKSGLERVGNIFWKEFFLRNRIPKEKNLKNN